MARRKTTTLHSARQSLLKGIKSVEKSARKSARQFKKGATKRIQAVQRARDEDTLAKWRQLRKIGLINTKKAPARKRLTVSTRARINKVYREIQAVGHYEKGRIHRPLVRQEYSTRTGKPRVRYVMDDYFQFYRTQRKTKLRRGITPTGKGYIFEKSKPEDKFVVNTDGSITEKTGGYKIVRRMYTGKEILEFRDDLESGRVKLGKRQYIEYRPWGSERTAQVPISADDFIDLVNEYESQMNMPTFEAWLDKSEIYILG